MLIPADGLIPMKEIYCTTSLQEEDGFLLPAMQLVI
jgi:hypothetical protein